MNKNTNNEVEKIGLKKVIGMVQEAAAILRGLEKQKIAEYGHDTAHSSTFAHFALELEHFLSSDNDEAGLVPYFRAEHQTKARVKFYEHKGIKVTIPED